MVFFFLDGLKMLPQYLPIIFLNGGQRGSWLLNIDADAEAAGTQC